ncbi:MAG: holo-ACP synthase [Candidatus Omnitrophota bacterium]
MILGHGIDIIEISRIKNAVEKHGKTFLKRIFTDKELKYANSRKIPYQHLAGRFAAKEAFTKAFGGANGIGWKEVEVINLESGKPALKLSGRAAKIKNDRNIDDVFVSISHTKYYAVASVLLMKKGGI